MSEMSEREKRLKKLTFRAEHRGIRELDILVGGFAKENLDSMNDHEMDQFEALMHAPDQQFYAILREEREVPDEIRCDILERMIKYTRDRNDV